MRRRAPLAALCLCACLAGCTLVIGDIPLPDDVQRDGDLPDLGLDATQPDAAPVDQGLKPDLVVPSDAAWPDAFKPDMAVPPDAAWPDALVPDAGPPPPWDVGTLAGGWHLYGISAAPEGEVFSLRLELDGQGLGRMLTFSGELLRENVAVRLATDDPTLVRLNLFPLSGSVRGALDPVTGFGVLTEDAAGGNPRPTFVLAIREGSPYPLPAAGLYTAVYSAPGLVGLGEAGSLSGAADLFTQRARTGVGGLVAEPVERDLQRVDELYGRHRLLPTDGTDELLLSVTPDGLGAVGLSTLNGQTAGLAFTWTTQRDGFVLRETRLYCGSARFVDGAMTVVAESISVVPEVGLTFEDGRIIAIEGQPGALLLTSAAGFVVGETRGLGLVEPALRTLVVIPMGQGETGDDVPRWGLTACVTHER